MSNDNKYQTEIKLVHLYMYIKWDVEPKPLINTLDDFPNQKWNLSLLYLGLTENRSKTTFNHHIPMV